MRSCRVLVGIPSMHIWEAEFGMSLLFMANYMASHHSTKEFSLEYSVHNKRGSILPNLRSWILQDALKGGYTHVLFVDSDQTFPKDVVHKLLSHKKHVVAANIATKMFPSSPTARSRGGVAGKPVYTLAGSTGLEEVWRIGTGVMLIDLNLFKREGMEPPWFSMPWNPELEAHNGEDWFFCEMLQKAGVKIYIDHDVSKEVGHVGKMTYGHDVVIPEEMQHAGGS